MEMNGHSRQQAVLVHGDIEVHDVALLQFPRVWHAMQRDLVRGGAEAPGEAVVVDPHRVGVPRDHKLAHHAVHLLATWTGSDGGNAFERLLKA